MTKKIVAPAEQFKSDWDKLGATPSPPSDSAGRKIPQIGPQHLIWDLIGIELRHGVINAPPELIADDTKRTDEWMWGKLQRHPQKALRAEDQLLIRAFDRSWRVRAIVSAADVRSVVLAGFQVISTPQRQKPLLEDENYRLIWVGNGFRVQRKRDGQLVSQVLPTERLAEIELRNQYPTPLGTR